MSTKMPKARRLLSALGHGFTLWLRRGRTRKELHGLDDRTLHDIGISRCDASRESTKPFWMP
jgi:uncharacterized protein YjiS (DUF1127 family)